MNDMYESLYYLGVYGPLILLALSLLVLKDYPKYLFFYITGLIFNSLSNIVLKIATKRPRPSIDPKIFQSLLANNPNKIPFDFYGMPSGHAQSIAFTLSFILFTLGIKTNKNFPLWALSLFIIISLITIFQRYMNNRHTLLQLLVGTLIGILFGYATHQFAQKSICGKLEYKKDDLCLLR